MAEKDIVDMETLNGYQPLAGTGFNTIRKDSQKYKMLHPGDGVIMRYVSDGRTVAVEQLIVKSVAWASLEDIVKHHAHQNHSPGIRASLRPHETAVAMMKHLYSGSNSQTGFVVIYFN